MNRRNLLRLAAAIVVAAFPLGVKAETSPLLVGVAPHTSARIILEMYQPLRERLQADLGQPVEIVTAPDFTEFVRRALGQEYDIAITTGHQARLLQVDGGYQPLVTYGAVFRSVVVVKKDSKAAGPRDFSGTTIIGLSPTSLVTQWGERWLKTGSAQGLQVRYVSAADSVAQLILAGDASAGLMSLANFMGLAPDVRDRLRLLVQSEAQLGRVYMLNSRLGGRREAILKALAAFTASPAGQQYFAAYRLEGYRGVKQAELEAMEPFTQGVRDELNATRR